MNKIEEYIPKIKYVGKGKCINEKN